MIYDFNETVPRLNTCSVKWDTAGDSRTLPMWIADMDFRTFPPITTAVANIAAQGYFGYNTVPASFYDSIIDWWQKRHDCTIERNWILASTGVIAAISASLAALIKSGDEVIVQPPVYNHFFNVLNACGCKVVANHLLYTNGQYEMDFEDLAEKASSGNAKVLLLCSPHNPAGRVWRREELEEVAGICSRYGLTVISDEIHSDLVFQGHEHIPFISLEGKYGLSSVTCSSATKTFNLSGLHTAYMFVSDHDTRKMIEKQLWARAAGYPGLMATGALTVAYQQGEEWLEELIQYLHDNYLLLRDFLARHLPEIKAAPLEATYLVWLDCSSTGLNSAELARLLLKNEKLWLNAGNIYGSSGEGFLRINIACPRDRLLEGLQRFRNQLSKPFTAGH